MSEVQFRRLSAMHRTAVLSYLAKRTFGDPQLAEDLTQETFLRALHHPEILSADRQSALPWLYRVARNLLIDHLRSRRHRPVEVGSDDLDMVFNESAAANEIDLLLTSWSVRSALASLSDQHRAVVTQIYFEEHSVNAAAEILGVPPGTVKSRCHYALRSLRSTLREHQLVK
ncbi:sigma-70 family RNA polymerase sigma factor [Kitasatospora acidiphila]|uniref:RNA polymerase sigma factor n=1 Tax=Kitasatospora acidiphila TaxID=2567942 RepID=A0A540W1Y7_9ACTN|nr:sigma-70 family RNA polymerase sigma factor [Kitasatospora acidiphila]TQF03039.1 sigma-70 family RNA polymerase sigma factor [Kitasatospora acidiphila]